MTDLSERATMTRRGLFHGASGLAALGAGLGAVPLMAQDAQPAGLQGNINHSVARWTLATCR
ncbi:MAG: hypothetical protein ACO1OA_02930 [Paracoccus marcusii]